MRTATFFLFCALTATVAAAQATVTGVVRDQSGGVVSGAAVVVRGAAGGERQTVTGPDGRFTVDAPAGQATLVVRAGGFAEKTQAVPGAGDVEVVLEPASLFEAVTVTPTRTEQRLGDVAASVRVVDRETIRQSPATVADDVLRLVPTFSLFRRTSSLSAHPTAQGVSLRGIGPSGVSRSLVLIDGVPFNDPFGGWVYWTRIPLESVERIEVVDGTSSSVYGNYAMGGVINVVSARPRPRAFELRTQYGNKRSPKADFLATDVWGKVGVSLEGSAFTTDGFPQVIANERGAVDTKAKVEYQNVTLKVDYSPTDRVSVFGRGGYFREERDNAKITTLGPPRPEANDTIWKAFSGGMRSTLPDQSDLQARIFVDIETFQSNFMAVAAGPAPALTPRAVGRMTLLQRVPTDGVGASAQWAKAISSRHLFTAGGDWRRVDGASLEQGLDATTGTVVTLVRDAGGTQQSSGAFVQGQFWPSPKLSLTVSGRLDRWRNYNGRNLETTVATGLPTAANRTLPDRDDTVVSPRAALLYHVTDKVTAWGSLGSGFRAPTLNELYRQFRVGVLLTLANDQLAPERLVGGEIGVNVAPVRDFTVRTTWFDNRVKNPVSNVTIATNTQQRQNLGRTRIWGVQSDAEYRAGRDWRLGAGYQYNQATVREFRVNPALVGKVLPQVPAHRGSVSVAYANPRYVTVAVSGLFFGRQFDDDLNTRVKPGESTPGLPAYGVMEMSVLRSLGRNLDVFFGVQNLFDEEYIVQLLPTTTGSPRLINGGVRVRWAQR
ncbi:MAG: putative TonB-dependent receptor [Acidobacteria bacterium]|nr:putative TonB-dependent receptor [Acidobacteriota bacterium]